MALEEKLDCPYVAKNISQYLNVRTLYTKTLLLRIAELAYRNGRDLTTGESYREMKDRLESQRKNQEKRASALDLNTKNERAAYRFALYTKCFIPYWENDAVNKKEFENNLLTALNAGLDELKAEYIHFENRQVKINEEFIEKSYTWLLDQIYSRTTDRRKVQLFGVTELSMEGDTITAVSILPKSRWATKPVNTTFELWKK